MEYFWSCPSKSKLLLNVESDKWNDCTFLDAQENLQAEAETSEVSITDVHGLELCVWDIFLLICL
jgi:hypothetical protein